MTQPPEEPPREVFAQQRRSGCGTLLVALLVLAVITGIVIFRSIRRAGLDFKLTMAARTRRLIVLCDGGGLA
jgi:hypothetical protein